METQGDFVQSLAAEVRAASFTSIEDLVAFVNWLDEELSFLVHHFIWQKCLLFCHLLAAAFVYFLKIIY